MGAEHISAMTGILAPPPEVPPATKLEDYPATEVGQTRISQVQRQPRQRCYGDWRKLMESEGVATPSQVLEVHYHVVVSPNCALQMLQRFEEQEPERRAITKLLRRFANIASARRGPLLSFGIRSVTPELLRFEAAFISMRASVGMMPE
jgi:hypothetical protein